VEYSEPRDKLDAALIVSECVDSRLRGDLPDVMCELDIKKADDHVN